MERNYIVRIYQQNKPENKDEAGAVIGLVEEPVTGTRHLFHSADELCSILLTDIDLDKNNPPLTR